MEIEKAVLETMFGFVILTSAIAISSGAVWVVLNAGWNTVWIIGAIYFSWLVGRFLSNLIEKREL